jgi:hypothetical protein
MIAVNGSVDNKRREEGANDTEQRSLTSKPRAILPEVRGHGRRGGRVVDVPIGIESQTGRCGLSTKTATIHMAQVARSSVSPGLEAGGNDMV